MNCNSSNTKLSIFSVYLLVGEQNQFQSIQIHSVCITSSNVNIVLYQLEQLIKFNVQNINKCYIICNQSFDYLQIDLLLRALELQNILIYYINKLVDENVSFLNLQRYIKETGIIDIISIFHSISKFNMFIILNELSSFDDNHLFRFISEVRC